MLFGLRLAPAPAIAAPMPPRPPTSTTRALGSCSICRRSVESVLVSLPAIGRRGAVRQRDLVERHLDHARLLAGRGRADAHHAANSCCPPE
jgi:hypothetical protein